MIQKARVTSGTLLSVRPGSNSALIAAVISIWVASLIHCRAKFENVVLMIGHVVLATPASTTSCYRDPKSGRSNCFSRSFLTGNFAPRAPQICLDVQFASAVLGHGACWVHDVRLFSPEKDYFATYNWRPFGQKNPGGSHRLDVSQAPKEVPWTVS